MVLHRALEKKIIHLAKKFPVITVTGPRQSGKTTLIKNIFPDKMYFSLEDPDTLLLVKNDTRGFLERYKKGLIIDEAQLYPELFSYIQTHVDKHNKSGQIVLSGSQNFLLLEKISQSLAGRTAIVRLLPFSLAELHNSSYDSSNLNSLLYKGMYPRLYDKRIAPIDFYPSYINSYVERDVRQLKNISNLSVFIKFLKLCAARIGQLVNFSSLAVECGVSENTIKAWFSVLETRYIVYFLRPYHNNLNKRLVKTPKLYFWDTGLACSLLGITEKAKLPDHYLRGNLFENFIINEIQKQFYNQAVIAPIYFWRDKTGHEVDCILERNGKITAIEIKSGQTFHRDFLNGLDYFAKLYNPVIKESFLIMGANTHINSGKIKILSWDFLKEGKI